MNTLPQPVVGVRSLIKFLKTEVTYSMMNSKRQLPIRSIRSSLSHSISFSKSIEVTNPNPTDIDLHFQYVYFLDQYVSIDLLTIYTSHSTNNSTQLMSFALELLRNGSYDAITINFTVSVTIQFSFHSISGAHKSIIRNSTLH